MYAVPAAAHISDLNIVTTAADATGVIEYSIDYEDMNRYKSRSSVQCAVEVYDADNVLVGSASGCAGTIKISNANLWWPIGMHSRPGYLYTARFKLINGTDEMDVYEQKIGIRDVNVTSGGFMINNRNFYFTGFGTSASIALHCVASRCIASHCIAHVALPIHAYFLRLSTRFIKQENTKIAM